MSKKPNTAVRYDDPVKKKIASYLREGNSNQAAKRKFGCSAHWAGRLRDELKIAAFAPAPSKPKSTKAKAKAKPAKKRVPKKAAALL
jgi:hypothetical protein